MKSLATLDRGEFRWEFLTPWVDRDLTRTDKVIVCSTFIGLAVVAQELVEPSTALAQHLSYVATFFSYAAGDQVVYRAIAILASLLEIFAYGVEDGAFLLREDAIPEGYNIIFIIVNSYYVLRWAPVWKSNFGRPTPSTRRASVAASARWRGDSTPSTRRCPRGRVGSP